ncbi:MAG: class I SAM-dependent methyltransferase [Candidatus Omnitrophica bacterium]|nr:class I SAM-dependent methyltransferase [Candidatus Omnitrophota bacterium]
MIKTIVCQKNRVLLDSLEVKRWPYYLILPLSWLVALWMFIKKTVNAAFNRKQETELLIFDGIGKYGKIIKKHVAGWKAVDLIYNHCFGEDRSLGGLLDDFWFGCLNCQAARNRFKLAKRELEHTILGLRNQKEVRIISLASGTGQIESETIAKIKKLGINTKIILIDKENEALKRAIEFISANGVQKETEIMHCDATRALEATKDFKPHIITAIALLDYFTEKEIIGFISKIYHVLSPGGFFIASNTMPNVEMPFVKWVVGWPLVYRKSKDLADIFEKSGFSQYEIISEPLHIQNIIVAKRFN